MQAFKVDKKQEEEASFFFREVASIKSGKSTSSIATTYTERDLFGGDGKTGTGAASSGGINFDKYDAITVTRSGPQAYASSTLEDFNSITGTLPAYLAANIQRMKYAKPTPIQKHAIPLIMDGRDVLCAAQTGSGKTFAFLMPLLADLSAGRLPAPKKLKTDGSPITTPARPRILILAPTRELASQIHLESLKLSFGQSGVKCVCVYGGANARGQLSEMAAGVDILVATPGRLTDFLNRDLVYLGDCHSLVLDEADRMLDMGFKPQIERIMKSGLPPSADRRTCMFSATFPVEIQQLAKAYMRPFVYVAVGRVGSTTESITQEFLLVPDFTKQGKTNLLFDVLQKEPAGQPTIVFVQKKRTATQVCKALCKESKVWRAVEIHGDRSQSQRESALLSFRNGTATILVATDVAARGLDIPHVAHVVNYDLPCSAEEIDSYVHRIGRTGRAGKVGKATSFFVPGNDPKTGNGGLIDGLKKILTDASQTVPEFFEKGFRGVGRPTVPVMPASTNQGPAMAPSIDRLSVATQKSIDDKKAAQGRIKTEQSAGRGGRGRGAAGRGRGAEMAKSNEPSNPPETVFQSLNERFSATAQLASKSNNRGSPVSGSGLAQRALSEMRGARGGPRGPGPTANNARD